MRRVTPPQHLTLYTKVSLVLTASDTFIYTMSEITNSYKNSQRGTIDQENAQLYQEIIFNS
jgi:purine-nucleoside phosphorylase